MFDRGFEDRVGHVLQHPTAPELHKCLEELISCIEHGQTRIRAMKTLRNAVLGRKFGYGVAAPERSLGQDFQMACRADKPLSGCYGAHEVLGELDLAMASMATSQCVCNVGMVASGHCLGSGSSSASQVHKWNSVDAGCWAHSREKSVRCPTRASNMPSSSLSPGPMSDSARGDGSRISCDVGLVLPGPCAVKM